MGLGGTPGSWKESDHECLKGLSVKRDRIANQPHSDYEAVSIDIGSAKHRITKLQKDAFVPKVQRERYRKAQGSVTRATNHQSARLLHKYL